MLLHLVKSKVSHKDNDSHDVIINLESIISIHFVKLKENGHDFYCIGLSTQKEDFKESHDNLETLKASLAIILSKLGMEENEIFYTLDNYKIQEFNLDEKKEKKERKIDLLKILSN